MRRLISILVLILVASSCSTDESVLLGNDGGSTQPSRTVGDGSVEDSAAQASAADGQATSTTEPAPEPVWNAPDADPVNVRLAPEDVLLPEDALGAPWEHQHRTLDAITYDAGPQQSDCGDFWRAEQIVSQATANALWWRDGANLVHNVVPFYEFGEAESALAAAARVADAYPIISWGEGGDYLVSPVSLDIDAIDGVETVSFLVDEGSGQQRWMVFSQRENLLSILSVPTWKSENPVVEAEVGAAAALAAKRLSAAGPERSRPTPTTTTTQPVAPPRTSTTTPAIIIEPLPSETTIPTARTEPDGLPEDLVALLLTDEDLKGTGLSVRDTSSYPSNPSSAVDLPACPQLATFYNLDAEFEVERHLRTGDLGDINQLIGRATDREAAQALISADFDSAEPCLEDLLQPDIQAVLEGDERGQSELAISTEPIEIQHTDAATLLELTIWGGRNVVIMWTVGDIVTMLSFPETAPGQANPEIDPLQLATLAAANFAQAG